MLLGMDFLSKYRAKLDLEKLTLTLNGKTVNVKLEGSVFDPKY
jgi:hypothetical protein